MRNVFASVDAAPLVEDPYPHLVIENAVPADLAETLLRHMPPAEVFTGGAAPGSNVRFALPSPQALSHPATPEVWKAALNECNASMSFLLRSFLQRLGPHLLAAYPDFAGWFAPLDELRAVPRYGLARGPHEVGVDAQMVINTPALRAGTSVRGPHLDLPNKLISALLYLRAPDDDSKGGELELYAPLRRDIPFNQQNETSLDNVRLVRTYPYRHNLLILPLCTPTALHGVSPRGQTARPRYHLHLVGEMAAPLFAIPRQAAA